MSSQTQRDLLKCAGARYAEKIVHAWSAGKISVALESQRQQLLAVRTFFKWTAASRGGAALKVSRSVKQTGSLPPREIVNAALSEFCSALGDREDLTIVQTKKAITRRNLAHLLSAAVKRLASQGAFPPDLRVRIRLSKDPRERNRSLGELHQAKFGRRTSESLAKLNARLLAAIRRCAEKDLLEQDELSVIRARITNGETSTPPLPLAEAVTRLKRSDHGSRGIKSELVIAESFLADRFKSGNFSRYYQSKLDRALTRRFGSRTLNRWLGPTSVDLSAALLMALCDTGWNTGPLYTLKIADVKEDVNSGKILLSSVKMRSRGRRVKAELDLEPVTVELWKKRKGTRIGPATNMKRWSQSIKQFCDLTGTPSPHTSAHFWMLPTRSGLSLSPPSYAAIYEWIREFQVRHKDDPDIGGLKFCAKNIRTSVLQAINGGEPHQRLQTQLVAGHKGAGTTFLYLRSEEFLSDLKKYIRHYQELIQAAMSKGIKNAPILFEMPQGRLDFLNKLARKRGPSLFRSAIELPKNGAGASAKKKLSLKVFAASRSSMEALYLTHKSAELSLERGPVDERWARIWLPFYALLKVIIEKIQKSPYARLYREISELADEKLRLGKAALPTVY